MTVIVSVSHDVVYDNCIAGKPFEMEKGGWYTTFLRGVSKKQKVIAIHPTKCKSPIVWHDKNFVLVKFPTDIGRKVTKISSFLSKLNIYLRLENISLISYRVARRVAEETDGVIYLHEFRRKAGAYIALREFRHLPLILQQHSSKSPLAVHRSILRRVYWGQIDKLIRNLDNFVVFALSEQERRFFEMNYGVKAYLRPMFVDYDKIAPVAYVEKIGLRRKWGFEEDDIIILTYGGNPLYRGVQYLPLVLKRCGNRKLKIVATSLPTSWIRPLKERGILALPRISDAEYLELLKLSDLFILLLHPAFKPLGIQMSVAEALAAGLPVTSPSLIHYPNLDKVERLGGLIPYIDDLHKAHKAVSTICETINHLHTFNSSEIRSLTSPYYSLESFLITLDDAIRYLFR